jgi:hypothetical protein
MHKAMLTNALGCGEDSELQFTHMETLMWGRDMLFDGLCIPAVGNPISFQLESIDCRKVTWQLFSHHQLDIPIPFPITDVVSFKIGQSQHRKSATVLTDHFGLTWNYKTLNLRYGDVLIELE